jgi:hypothetical protein
VRKRKNGDVEILLMTSREGKWPIASGWPSCRMKHAKAAAKEAREDGVSGKIRPEPVGGRQERAKNPLKVRVYVLKVKRQNKRWPERHERRRKWLSPKTAAKLFLPKLRLGDHQPEDG